VMFQCHFLKFDTITIRLLQKIAIIDTISIFLKMQQPSQLCRCATVPTVGEVEEGRRPGGRTGQRWSDAIISVNRSAPVSYDGVVCGAFIQALHFVRESEQEG